MVLFSRPLRFDQQEVTLPDGSTSSVTLPVGRGVHVHPALDVVRPAFGNPLDVAIIFRQDHDYSEAGRDPSPLCIYIDR
jgi:hypothetical protein